MSEPDSVRKEREPSAATGQGPAQSQPEHTVDTLPGDGQSVAQHVLLTGAPGRVEVAHVLRMQRVLGNQAVSRMIAASRTRAMSAAEMGRQEMDAPEIAQPRVDAAPDFAPPVAPPAAPLPPPNSMQGRECPTSLDVSANMPSLNDSSEGVRPASDGRIPEAPDYERTAEQPHGNTWSRHSGASALGLSINRAVLAVQRQVGNRAPEQLLQQTQASLQRQVRPRASGTDSALSEDARLLADLLLRATASARATIVAALEPLRPPDVGPPAEWVTLELAGRMFRVHQAEVPRLLDTTRPAPSTPVRPPVPAPAAPLTHEQFLARFEATGLEVLDGLLSASEQRLLSEGQRYGIYVSSRPQEQVTADTLGLQVAALRIAAAEDAVNTLRVASARRALGSSTQLPRQHGAPDPILAGAEANLARIRQDAEQQYPILAGLDPRELVSTDYYERFIPITSAIARYQFNIVWVRLRRAPERVWESERLVRLTSERLGVRADSQEFRWVAERRAETVRAAEQAEPLRALQRDCGTIVRHKGGHAQVKHPTRPGRVTQRLHRSQMTEAQRLLNE